MDILALLKDHLRFIERFYNAAVEPFETTLRKIRKGEEPFVPARQAPEDYDGLEHESEWNEADECVCVVGSCSLGLLAKALQDYLREFILREAGVVRNELPRVLKEYKGEGWFEKYCAFLEKNTAFRWADSPVPKGRIEEINLTRNDFVHDPMVGGTWPFQSEEHLRKYPESGFAAMMGEDDKPEVDVGLRVTRENLTEHIEYVRQFCTFVQAQRTRRQKR